MLAEYTASLYIDVYEDEGSVPISSEFSAMGTAEEGQKPALNNKIADPGKEKDAPCGASFFHARPVCK